MKRYWTAIAVLTVGLIAAIPLTRTWGPWPLAMVGATALLLAVLSALDVLALKSAHSRLFVEHQEMTGVTRGDTWTIFGALQDIDRILGIVEADGTPAFIKALPKELVAWRNDQDSATHKRASAEQLAPWLHKLTDILVYRVNDLRERHLEIAENEASLVRILSDSRPCSSKVRVLT